MRTLLVITLLAACGSKPPAPTTPVETPPVETPVEAPPENDVLVASALAEQYEAGKAVYAAKKCDTCHEANGAGNPKNPPVIGDAALPAEALPTAKLRKGVTFTTAADVVAFVKAKMPIKEPGTLTDDEAHAVVSWMLSESKVALTRKLDATNAATITLR